MGILEKYICIFFTYSILGWFMETFRGYFKTKNFVNRGFLIGPYCPVYGIGVGLITWFLSKYVNDIVILFCMSIILCGILEYFTSWIMEKVFKARWWDYHNRKFNINGRICLETLLPFGILGTVLLKFFNPFILNVYEMIPFNIFIWILRFLCLVFVIDCIISFCVIYNFKKTAKQVENEKVKDDTEEISKMVKEVTTEKLEEIKDTTAGKIADAKLEMDKLQRKVTLQYKIFKRNVRYSGKKLYLELMQSEIKRNLRKNENKELLRKRLEVSQNKFKESVENISNNLKEKIKNFNYTEYTEIVKERFRNKSWLTNRLLNAFPNMNVISKRLKNKESNIKK